ncbi:hypothetical protein I316_04318 [Kwoniella heveanensis BCC8398]|uniref:Telomeric single stranded DNA binding POT1/Cdc13 domain-containing protein n=1 Tax=Kwoniella heveanensis BCC8398 TaxID=1296120 RepID=A0A1B9GSC1_9TREE|nr:hypothetical protein I316_04318 [Kwoniella heveanensis BCC8398]
MSSTQGYEYDNVASNDILNFAPLGTSRLSTVKMRRLIHRPEDKDPFAESKPIEHTLFEVNTVIPPSVHHTGRVKVVWGKTFPCASEIPLLMVSFKNSFLVPSAYLKNDYVVPTAKEESQKWEIVLALSHPDWTEGDQPKSKEEGQKIEAVVQGAINWADELLKAREEITVDLSGLKVVKTLSKGQTRQIELQGTGQRLVRTAVNKTKSIFEPLASTQSTSSGPPAWFDSSLPSVSSPAAPQSSAVPIESPAAKSKSFAPDPASSPTPAPGVANIARSDDNSSSRFRPLLSHKPPSLNGIASRPAGSAQTAHILTNASGQAGTKRKAPSNGNDGVAATSTLDSRSIVKTDPKRALDDVQDPTSAPAPKKRNAAQIGPPGWELMLKNGNAEQQVGTVTRTAGRRSSPHPSLGDDEGIDVVDGSPIEPPDSVPLLPDLPAERPSAYEDAPVLSKDPELEGTVAPANEVVPTTRTGTGPNFSNPIPSSPRSPAPPLPIVQDRPLSPTSRTAAHKILRSPRSPVVADVGPPTVQADEPAPSARKAMEDQVRAARMEQQAESSRAAQRRAANLDSLKRPFTINSVCYTPLDQVRQDTTVNIIGLVVESKPVNSPRSAGRDYTMSIVIADPSRYTPDDQDQTSEELMVITLFRPTMDALPQDIAPGNVVLIRGVKVTLYNNKIKGQCFNHTGGRVANSWVIMKSDKKMKGTHETDMYPALNGSEVDRMTQMLAWWQDVAGDNSESRQHRRMSSGLVGVGTSSPMGRQGSRNTSRPDMAMGSVRNGDFFNATFKILWVNANISRPPALEVYVTDGTVSPFDLRNFHNVKYPSIPSRAIFCLAIFDRPPENELPLFEHGNILRMHNVRCKGFNGELELSWSEKPSGNQYEQGWRPRRTLSLLERHDERAKVIERQVERIPANESSLRLKQLEKGETSNDGTGPVDQDHPPTDLATNNGNGGFGQVSFNESLNDNGDVFIPNDEPSSYGNIRPLQLATHISTVYHDPIENPLSTISQIHSNRTLPNKYRIRARVKSLHPRSVIGNDSFVQSYCKHCRATLKHGWTFCKSCNDEAGNKAEWRYRFVAILEEVDRDGVVRDEMAVIIADDEAAEFLPALPPYSPTTNPNEIARMNQRRSDINGQVYNILQGCKMDNVRPKPVIDFSLMVYRVDKPMPRLGLGPGARNRNGSRARSRSESAGGVSERGNGNGNGNEREGESVIVAKVFGMKCTSS